MRPAHPPKVLSPEERARLLEFACSARAASGPGEHELRVPRPAPGVVLLSQGAPGAAPWVGCGERGTFTGSPFLPPARRGPQPGFGEISGRGQRPGCPSEGTGSGSRRPPAPGSLSY